MAAPKIGEAWPLSPQGVFVLRVGTEEDLAALEHLRDGAGSDEERHLIDAPVEVIEGRKAHNLWDTEPLVLEYSSDVPDSRELCGMMLLNTDKCGCTIGSIYIEPRYRGTGLGTAAIVVGVEDFLQRPEAASNVTTSRVLTAAYNTFSALGFAEREVTEWVLDLRTWNIAKVTRTNARFSWS